MRNIATMILGVLVVTVAASVMARAQGQTPAMERVTFDQAVGRAIDKNPTVAEAATAVLRAEAVLQQSQSATKFAVNATASNATLNSASVFDGITTQPQNQTTLGVDVSYPLFTASRWALVAQSKDQIDVAKISAAEVRREIAITTAQAYLAVIVQRRQVDVNVRARDTANAHLDYAEKRLTGGVGTRLDRVRAQQEVSTDELRIENARLAVRRAQEALGVLLAAGGPIDAADDPKFEVPPTIDDATWMAARTDLQLTVAEQHAAERVWHDTHKEVWPTLIASFDPQLVEPSGLFQQEASWRLAVTFAMPIFQGGLNKALERQRQTLFDSQSLVLTAQQIQARSDVRLAQESVQSNERALASAQLSAQQAGDVVTMTTAAFEAGASTNLEVIDAQRSARDAETTVAIAEDAVRRAQLDLLVALGRFPK